MFGRFLVKLKIYLCLFKQQTTTSLLLQSHKLKYDSINWWVSSTCAPHMMNEWMKNSLNSIMTLDSISLLIFVKWIKKLNTIERVWINSFIFIAFLSFFLFIWELIHWKWKKREKRKKVIILIWSFNVHLIIKNISLNSSQHLNRILLLWILIKSVIQISYWLLLCVKVYLLGWWNDHYLHILFNDV